MVTAEEVKRKKYRNSHKAPAVGDSVVLDNGERYLVGRLGGVPGMFINCIFDDVLHLTNPDLVMLVEG